MPYTNMEDTCNACEKKQVCQDRTEGDDPWIYIDQYAHCARIGEPSYKPDEDWVIAALAEDFE